MFERGAPQADIRAAAVEARAYKKTGGQCPPGKTKMNERAIG
jgi:hypothetical protein